MSDTAVDAKRRGIPHMPALDGIRALAVIAVIIYHGDVGFLPGGFIGVDLFFVLSGFLITSLLLSEQRASGTIDLRRFWTRRFRRLLPAVLVFLVAVAIWSAIAADPTSLTDIRRASLAGLAYVANWYFIASGTSYGMTWSAPLPVLHLWSLSVEEQYYVVWPLIAGWLMTRAGRGVGAARRAIAGFGVVVAVVSTLWMVLLATRGASTDRMYFGTDTRAATILLGVALAAVLQPLVAQRHDANCVLPVLSARVAGALGAVGSVFLVIVALVTHEKDLWLYRGGFTLVALACTAVIAAAVTHPNSDRIFGIKPLEWVGTRSYGLYLWHWGVIVALAVAFPQFTGWPRLAVAVVVTGLISEASYRFLENPIRTGTFHLPRPRLLVPASFVVVAGLLVLGTNGAEDLPEYLQQRPADDIEMEVPVAPSTSSTTTVVTSTVPGETTASTTTEPPGPRPTRVALMGDSVAASLSKAMAQQFKDRGIAFADASTPGCGVLEGDIADERGQLFEMTASCSGAIANLQRSVIKRTNPDLMVVLSSWEAGDRIVNGVWHPFGSAEADAQILDLYDQMLDRVTVRGARVALVTMADPIDSPRGPAKPDQMRRLRHMNELLEQVAQANPQRATFVRLDDIVCPTDPCPKVVEGIELRGVDGTHFADPSAANFVATRLVDRLVEVPAGVTD